ncbi:MAG: TauD/TfdA family dioxygenase [Caldilineaceae bacterium]
MTAHPIPTPDFERYSMAMPLTAATVAVDAVAVTWADGHQSRFHCMWLRDNCACEHCIDHGSRERVNSILLIPAEPRPAAVSISPQGGLLVTWVEPVGACVVSHYHPGWLRAFDYANGLRPVDTWETTCWGQELESHPPIFNAAEVFDNEDVRYEFLTTIRRLGLAIVTDMSKDLAAFERISTQVGLLRDMNWGKIFEIVAKPEGEYIANRGIALDAHSDASTREYMPGFQIFQCVENTSPGGESFWVDGFHIAALLRARHPDAYELLTTVPWEFANRARGSHYRWNAPILELDRHGQLSSVRDTTWLRAPLCLDFDRVPQLFRAYRLFAGLKAARESQVERKLVEGDVAFVDNRRVLHGRRAFDPTHGLRHIRTCYGEREELLSSIRMIERARAARASG